MDRVPPRFIAAAACLSLSLATVTATIAQDGSKSLEELFGIPDWSAEVAPREMGGPSVGAADTSSAPRESSRTETTNETVAGRPRLDPQPLVRPALPDPAVRQTIEALISRRNQIIDRCSFFKTVETIWQEEVELVRRLELNRVAAINLNAANARLQQVVAMGIHGEKFLPAAQTQQRVAKDTLQTASKNVVLQREKLHPLYQKIGGNLGPLMQVYHDMRRLLVPDRRDPNRAAVLAGLELATAQRDDFYEGRVLAAMSQAYDGNTAAAERHLTAACVGLDRYALYGTPWAADCCLAYLFLGQPGNVETYVARLKRLDSKRQTPLICWLVGQAEMLEGKDNEAKKYFERALSRAGFYDKKQPPVPEPLLGDVAFFYATAKNDTIRNLDKAKALLERVPEQSDRWEVLRARAALLAAEDDTTAARATLDACRERAPGTLEKSLDNISLAMTNG